MMSDMQMAACIIVMLVAGWALALLAGKYTEKFGDWIRAKTRDFKPEPPRYWRNLSADDTKH